MQLTQYTDYSLRMLVYLGAVEGSATIAEIAERYGISKNHLVKVAHNLGKQGYIHTSRGRLGGLRLAHPPERINLAEVVRTMEPHFHLVECFNREANQCVIAPACRLQNVIGRAHEAFLEVLRDYTLADLLSNREDLLPYLGHNPGCAERKVTADSSP